MRHVLIRGIITLVWVVVAIKFVLEGDYVGALFDFALAVVFGYSAYITWKKEER